MKLYDIIIIGGGLSGLALAIQLVERGRTVLVVEKQRYPFHRVCGEYLSMESFQFLKRLGMPLEEMNLPVITQLRVTSVSGKRLDHDLDMGGIGISRYKLDHMLAMIALKKGVELIEDCRADQIVFKDENFLVSTIHGNYSGRVVAGAFGKRSNMDKKLNRNESRTAASEKNWVGVKYHIHADIPPDRIELHNFNEGYCGISMVEDQKCCLCYLTSSENLRKSKGSIPLMENSILSANPYLEKYFSDRSAFLLPDPVTISQITFENKQPVEQNVIMVGDAAGMIAPLCGNGMSMAFHSSLIAFNLIEKFLDNKILRNKMEQEYWNQWQSIFAFRLKTGRMIQPLLVKSPLSNMAVGVLKAFPFLLKPVMKFTHGNPF